MTLFFIFLFGLIVGSFLNVVIWRTYKGSPPHQVTPTIFGYNCQKHFPFILSLKKRLFWCGGKSFIKGRSICPKCHHRLFWFDNIPLVSFIILGGKCRWCRKPISWQYPLVEMATAILFCLAYLVNLQLTTYNLQLTTVRDWFFISILIVIFVQDLCWQVILDQVTLPAMAMAFIFNLVLGFSWWQLLISAIIGGSFFAIQYFASQGRWIGGGDIRMGALMGLMLGWQVLLAIMIAYWLGAIVGICLILSGKKKFSSKIPLGTFLAIGTIITLFWGNVIFNNFLSLISF